MFKQLLVSLMVLVVLSGVEAGIRRSLDYDDWEERRVYEAPVGSTDDTTIEQVSRELPNSKEDIDEIVLDSEEDTWHVGASYWYSSPLMLKK